MNKRSRSSRTSARCHDIEPLEPRQLLAVQVYDGALNGKIVYTSPGHGWQWSSTLNRYATDRGDNNEIVEDFGNQDQFSYYVDYILRAGGTVVPMRPVGHQTREIVLDNDSPGVVFSGAWTNSSSTIYYDEDYGASADAIPYRYSSISATETATATYTPTFTSTTDGFYPVYAWTRAGTDRTRQLYRINHSGGATEIRVDHRLVGSGWIYLGTYHFASGSGGNVQISNQSTFGGTYAFADAIRFGNGMGDFVDSPTGAPGVSGKPREDENSFHWIARAVGVGTSLTTATGASSNNNVSGPSNFARHMNQTAASFGTSVYIGFHSNAGGGRGARGLIDSDQGTPHQNDLALFTGRQINQDMQALDGVFEHDWIDGVSHTFSGGFGEIDLGAGAEFDATIIETAFHDNAMDAQLMRDPKARDQIARSVYEATLEYFDVWGGLTAPVSQPDRPTGVRSIVNANGDVTISWTAPATRAGGPQAATGYRVYTSRNGYGFSDPRSPLGTATSLTIPSAELDGNAYYFKVAAFNTGGEGPASTVVGARKNGSGGGGGTNRILIVNGFDRYDRAQNERYDYAFTGDELVDRVRRRYNNTFDYVARFGEAVEAFNGNGTGVALGFDTAENEHVADNTVNLNNYQTVLWISGTESTQNETFSSTEQGRITTFLGQPNRRLFVSGAEIGWDLDRPTGPTANDRTFYNQRLRADYVADEVPTYTADGAAGSIFSDISLAFDNGNNSNDDNIYDVVFADVLAAINGSTIAMNYAGGNGGAAVQWADPPMAPAGARGVNMGFPFETITSVNNRNAVMAAVLNFFETAVSATPTGVDLLAADDTGSSNSDNRTNRDNSSGAKTLRFVVSGTVAGSNVTVYAGSTAIGSAPGVAGLTTVTTDGAFDLSDGEHTITATQVETGKTNSPSSPGLVITIDTVAPVADVVNVSPDPRITGVDSVDITFTRAVSGFNLADLSLTRDGGPNLLTGAQTVTTSDNLTFTLNNLASLTQTAGTYVLGLAATGSGITETLAGNALGTDASDTWVNDLPAWLAAGSVAAWDDGSSTLTVTGAATIIADPQNSGDMPVINASGAGGVVTIDPASDLDVHAASLNLSNGANATITSLGESRTAANHRVLVLGALSIDAASKLDITDNDVVVDYGGATPIGGIEADVARGYNVTGDWLGNGITSSVAAADGNFTIAVADNSSLAAPFGTAQGGSPFTGVDVDLTTVLVKYTHRIDVNLDGLITPDDAAIFGTNYGESEPAFWSIGDFDFDGLFTPTDAAIFGTFYDESLPLI